MNHHRAIHRESARQLVVLIIAMGFLSFSLSQAHAQSRPKLGDVNNRLIRVEKVLDQSLLNMLQQIESLKLEIRGLRGEIESQTYQIDNLKKRNRELYADTDGRIAELEEKIAILMGDQPAPDLPLDDTSGDGTLDDSTGSIAEKKAVYIPSDETNNTRNDVARAGDLSADAGTQASAQEKAAYITAYDLVMAKQYKDAVTSFEEFLGQYPNGALADNAWYWQGEALYAERQFKEAIINFTVVTDSFPDSRKVPDARLKIAFSYYENGDYAESRGLLEQIRQDYPGGSASVLARKRLLEMNQAGL